MADFYSHTPKKGYILKYGFYWKQGTPALAVELMCFREKLHKTIPPNYGGTWAYEHFINAAKILWPEKDMVDTATGRKIAVPVKFIWHPWAVKIIKNLIKYEVLAIAGCGGCGKSEVCAIWLIINFICDPENTLCFATSTTISASKKRIWGKIIKYWTQIEKQVGCGRLVDSAGMIRYIKNGEVVQGDLAGITLVPAEKKKEKDALDKLKGMHQKRILFVGDELGSLSPSVATAALMNLRKSTKYFQFVGIDNPNDMMDAFGDIAIPKDGWNSITVEDEEWFTKRGKCLHFDDMKNPNVLAGEEVYDWMTTKEAIEREILQGGANTAAFWRMYRGFWTPVEVSDQVYSQIEVINAKGMEKAIWRDNDIVNLSFLDPSFTNGGDRCIAYFGKVGYNLDGFKQLEFTEYLTFKEDMTDKSLTRTQQAVAWWRKACIDRNVQPRFAGYDASGAGGPFGDVVEMSWSKEVMRLQFGGKASDLPVSAYDPTPSCERYANAVTEIWFSGKEYLRSNQIRGICSELLSEMGMRKLDRRGDRTLSNRLRVMPKSEMKVMFGISPDLADAAFGLLAVARNRLSLDSSSAIRKQDTVNTRPAAQKNGIFSRMKSVFREAA